MASTLLSARDLHFLLYEWLDTEALTARPRYSDHSRETFDAALELAERVATDHFAPHNKASDANEPHFDGERVHVIPEVRKALEVYAETGLAAAGMPTSVGGAQMPQVVSSACGAYFQAANLGTSAYPFLTSGNARLLLAHGSPSRSTRGCSPWWRGASPAPCACPSRRRAAPWPTSPPAPRRTARAATGCSATRCGSRAATTS
ncbi:acyl-CoA dehydrogenase family protein [Nocardiopsis sp. ARC36]